MFLFPCIFHFLNINISIENWELATHRPLFFNFHLQKVLDIRTSNFYLHNINKGNQVQFEKPLYKGILIRRYKRFLADIKLDNGLYITAHCPNSGSMMGLSAPGNIVYVWDSQNPNRKLQYTWELVQLADHLIGINTNRPNYLVKEAIEDGIISELQDYHTIKTEVPYGKKSRLDLYLTNGKNQCFVEVKNVTLVSKNMAYFPDAVTTRGTKHLKELSRLVEEGKRGLVCFVIQRSDASSFEPARHIDPVFATTLEHVVSRGVEAVAYQTKITLQGIQIVKKIPINF